MPCHSNTPKLRINDASPDRLPLSDTLPLHCVVGHTIFKEQPDPDVTENSLHHTESLEIVSSGNLQNVSLQRERWDQRMIYLYLKLCFKTESRDSLTGSWNATLQCARGPILKLSEWSAELVHF